MIFWSGWGIAVFFIWMAAAASTVIIVQIITGDGNSIHTYPILKFIMCVWAAVLTVIATILLKRLRVSGKLSGEYAGDANGQDDRFMFVPMKYWPLLFVALGVLLYLLPPPTSVGR